MLSEVSWIAEPAGPNVHLSCAHSTGIPISGTIMEIWIFAQEITRYSFQLLLCLVTHMKPPTNAPMLSNEDTRIINHKRGMKFPSPSSNKYLSEVYSAYSVSGAIDWP